MSLLSLQLPGGQSIQAPAGIQQGGLKDKLIPMIQNAITLMIIFAIILVVIFLVWGGIQWASSGGDKAKLSAARARLTWAIVGLIVVFLSFMIISVFSFFFGVHLLG